MFDLDGPRETPLAFRKKGIQMMLYTQTSEFISNSNRMSNWNLK